MDGISGCRRFACFGRLVDEVAKNIPDPQTGANLFERLKAKEVVTASSPKLAKEEMDKIKIHLDALGTGSDFSPFLQHVGLPVLNLEFSGEDNSGAYHSIYDSYDNFIRFIDPGFYYSATLSKMAGHISLRMLNADILPFDFRILYKEIKTYTTELQTMISNLRESTSLNNEIIRKKYFLIANDTCKFCFAAVQKQEIPYIDFSPLQNAIISLGRAADHSYEVMNTKGMSEKQNGQSEPDALSCRTGTSARSGFTSQALV
ncbi:MAG: hypothetical protein WDM78_14260 [Puia sp.]